MTLGSNTLAGCALASLEFFGPGLPIPPQPGFIKVSDEPPNGIISAKDVATGTIKATDV